MSDPVANLYLEQEVLSASPAKLRWLLIQKCVKLSQVVSELWQAGDLVVADQWSLRLRDILNELLAGIHGRDAVAQQVSDLYVFMIKLLTEAELTRDRAKLGQLQSLLEIEAETWMLVQQQIARENLGPQDRELHMSADSRAGSLPPPPLGGIWSSSASNDTSLCIDA